MGLVNSTYWRACVLYCKNPPNVSFRFNFNHITLICTPHMLPYNNVIFASFWFLKLTWSLARFIYYKTRAASFMNRGQNTHQTDNRTPSVLFQDRKDTIFIHPFEVSEQIFNCLLKNYHVYFSTPPLLYRFSGLSRLVTQVIFIRFGSLRSIQGGFISNYWIYSQLFESATKKGKKTFYSLFSNLKGILCGWITRMEKDKCPFTIHCHGVFRVWILMP